ncbi:hypothetical protein A3C25_02035 [Candidatus Roizmanbacteria bacterium RIFCSPHIGHO2_02_FULL_38_11]|uniref:Glycosyltransferase 2-like domain-containing protein n=1 Tax=Candidatus Roizmanbacteria bacterium RIFCSPHIGHO2_02_FULL_38_11 TaxID=1802039 RepID=A0A1F7GWF5_9BACT|nr:MAG: hypothetical protein A3C25_02035 [Candidatus Roizmanbacteria bacterium RIFCSPHIGHO2_02_FULL_38_11]
MNSIDKSILHLNISIIIHTHNEEKNILSCIESAKLLSKKVVIIDMKSTDKTVDLAKKVGASVYLFPYSTYVEPAREFGIKKVSTGWVFLLDADERITSELAKEIKNLIKKTGSVEEERSDGRTESVKTYYKIPRKNIFGNLKWLKHGGWWPDYQIRLINKKYFKSWSKEIHSTPIITGETGYLQNPITHYFHGDLESMVEKTIIFEDIESTLLFEGKKEVRTSTFFRKFLGELYRRLFRSLGFLDGNIGIIESIYQAFSKTITYIYLYEKSRTLRSLS